MNRRTYLRTLGAAVGAAAVGSAGAAAAEGDALPEAVKQAPVGASNERVSDAPADAIDVRDHGAQLDGSHDDSGAIQDAVDAAAQSGTPDTVVIPEGTARMSEAVRFHEQHSGVTLKGSGSGTHLRLDGGFNRNHRLIYVRGKGSGVKDLTVRDLRLDGQGSAQNDWMGWGVVTYDHPDNSNLLFENLWVHDWAGTNLQLAGPGPKLNYVSSWGAKKKQGVATHGGTSSRPITVERSHFYDNSVHGLNAADGHTRVRHVLTEENGWGAKNISETSSCEWNHVIFRNNKYFGYMIPDGTGGNISFDNVLAEGNGRSGFRFVQNGTIDIGTMAARGNDEAERGVGNVYIGGPMDISADTIYAFDSHTTGLVFHNYDGGPSGTIETYVHGGNERVLRGGRASLSIGEIRKGEFPDIDVLNGETVESLDSDSGSNLAGLPVTDGLVLSLNAGAGVSTSDGQVTAWADQSGQGNDLTANGNPTLTTAPSGAQAISFDGNGDELVRTSSLDGFSTGSEPRTVVVVGKYESTGFGGVTYGSPSWNDAFGAVVNDAGELAVQGWSDANDYPSGVAGTGAGWLTQSVTYDGSQFVHYQNGEQIDSGTHSFATKDDKLTVGAELGTPPYLDMQVGAVAVYNRSLSDGERQEVEQYLRNQYL